MQNLTKDGKQKKPIFGSILKVLCLSLMSICLSICLFSYITICYWIFSTISVWQVLFKKSVTFSQCRLKYIKNISGTFKRTHSNYFPRTWKYFGWNYKFLTIIRCNEFSEAEVRLEGMLHLKLYLFKLTDFRTHPIGVRWLRKSTLVGCLAMCEFITVCKRSYRKVMFSQLCVILFIGGILSEEGTFHMGYTPLPHVSV